jgi:toxin ParE1/3/4
VNKYYVLSKGAAADLEDITRHTNEQWGEAQCLTYISQLEKAAVAVAKGEGPFKDLSAIHSQLRMAKCRRHYIL